MAKSGKTLKILKIAGYVITGTAVVAKAAVAAIVPLGVVGHSAPPTVWGDIRSEFGQPDTAQKLNPKLVEFVESAVVDDGFEDTIRLSYSMVSFQEVKALDELWVDTLIRNAGSDTIASFMAVRSTIDDVAVRTREDYLERWVWKTSNKHVSEGS